ncbi:unnamed protein product [Arabidopsis thaliana]|uniref:Pectinesterase n=1 Tax=Arabidopsis thaliana TaxID=3702 RepID=A0A5S9XH26_ARATH|nr:unnamed protein product [Arabidopsis thaliana]
MFYVSSEILSPSPSLCKNSSPALNPGIMGAQAVSLKVVGDKAAFYGCGLYGKQDTLLDQEI